MRPQDVKFDGWPHILKAQQFSRRWIETVLFPLSDRMEKMLKARCCHHLLDGKEMISLFCAESTRTRASFEIAMQRLGGRVIFSAPNARFSSAMGKEESLEDTVRALSEYGADVFVIRNDGKEPIPDMVKVCKIPIINAADNAEKDKQHPTQALLDLYTAYKYFGVIDGLTFAMIGDLKNGRTVRSLCYLLAKWSVGKIYFVSPKYFRIGSDIKAYLKRHKVNFEECADIRDVAPEVDVYYQTRTQKNLGSKVWDRTDKRHGFTIIDKEVINIAKKSAIIMHPLPCINEIVRKEVDDDPRAVYIEGKHGKPSQVECGLISRMSEVITVTSPEICCALI